MSTGLSGLGLPKKTLTKEILQYSAEKMRKNLQNWPKNVKNLQNVLNVSRRSSAEYDHVFWLEVDSEPPGPGLDARRFSLTSVNRFAGKCRKTSILQRRKNGFSAFSGEPVGRFSNRFFCLKALAKTLLWSPWPSKSSTPFSRYSVFRFFRQGFLVPLM